MTKNEFLEGLRKALGNDLDRETVQENVAYYDGYISVQVNIGRTEEEVTRFLKVQTSVLVKKQISGANFNKIKKTL